MNLSDKKVIIQIGDIHFGNEYISPKNLYLQLEKFFLMPIREIEKIDAVMINGDLFDSVLNLNSKAVQYAVKFIDKLIELSKIKNFEIHLLKGTPFHDSDQLNIFMTYAEKEENKFYIHNKPESYYIMKTYKTLFLPDGRFNKADRKIIDKLLDDKYDLICGHGIIDKYKIMHQESESMPTNPYLFSYYKMEQNCKGPIVFGHIHEYKNIDNRFFHGGSFTLLEPVDTAPGYLIFIIDDEDRSKYKFSRIINTDSPRQHRITISETDFDIYTVDEIIDNLDYYLNNIGLIDRVHLKFKFISESKNMDNFIILIKRYESNPQVTIIRKRLSNKITELKKKAKDNLMMYSYVLDDNIDADDKIVKFFNENIKNEHPKFLNLVLTKEDLKLVFNDTI